MEQVGRPRCWIIFPPPFFSSSFLVEVCSLDRIDRFTEEEKKRRRKGEESKNPKIRSFPEDASFYEDSRIVKRETIRCVLFGGCFRRYLAASLLKRTGVSRSKENSKKNKKKKKEKKGRKEGRKEVNSQAGARVTPRRDTGVAVRARGLATIPPG